MVLMLNLVVPQLVALLVEVFGNYLSIYFQIKNFGSVYYLCALVHLSFLSIVSKNFSQAIAQWHAIHLAEMMQQAKPKEEIQEAVSLQNAGARWGSLVYCRSIFFVWT